MERKYKYYPEDFPELDVGDIHYDLTFDVYDKETKANMELFFTLKKETDKIELDAKKLDIHEVLCDKEVKWEHDKKKNKLIITFGKKINAGEKLVIKTKNELRFLIERCKDEKLRLNLN